MCIRDRTKEAYAMARSRWKTAVERLRRIGVIPASAERRGCFIAGSALSAGAYAVAARPISNLMLQAMRRWVKRANYKGSALVSSEMYFLFSSMPMRADPVFVSAERGANFFAEVLQGGYWSYAELGKI